MHWQTRHKSQRVYQRWPAGAPMRLGQKNRLLVDWPKNDALGGRSLAFPVDSTDRITRTIVVPAPAEALSAGAAWLSNHTRAAGPFHSGPGEGHPLADAHTSCMQSHGS